MRLAGPRVSLVRAWPQPLSPAAFERAGGGDPSERQAGVVYGVRHDRPWRHAGETTIAVHL